MLVPNRKIDRLTMLTTAGWMPHLPTAQCSDPVVPSMAGAPRRRQSQRSRTRKGPRCLALLLEGSRPDRDAAAHLSSPTGPGLLGDADPSLGRGCQRAPDPRGGQGMGEVKVTVVDVLPLVDRVLSDVRL
jgi:hypothetical protein